MNILFINFKQMLLFIKKDGILTVACFIPILAGSFFKFALPYLIHQFKFTYLLEYFPICDLFLFIITPMIFCFISAMIILEEVDDHLCAYLAITPLTKQGYLLSRLGIPALFAIIGSILTLSVFQLIDTSFMMIVLFSLLSSMQGILIALVIVAFSTNKLEGMACTKLSSLMSVGIIIPFFLTKSQQSFFMFLPSYWFSKCFLSFTPLNLFLTIMTSLLWILLFVKQFMNKITK